MTNREAIRWFAATFDSYLRKATRQTVYSIDLLCAMALQETGEIWRELAGKMRPEEIALLCTGDTLDRASTFPRNKADLLSAPRGAEMFAIARNCLIEMARHVPAYQPVAAKPDKFCHGFGIFQYDIQFFKQDPQYFLDKKWGDIALCFQLCIRELEEARKRQRWSDKTQLSDEEKVHVAIAYNAGRSNLRRGFRQGHKSGGRYYGEYVFEYLMLAQSVLREAAAGGTASDSILPAAAQPGLHNKPYQVNDNCYALNLRQQAFVSSPNPKTNILAVLPSRHLVFALPGGAASDTWIEVETMLDGAYFRGYVARRYLREADAGAVSPSPALPDSQLPEAHLPALPGRVISRKKAANANSLSEAGMPEMPSLRSATALSAIIDWLDVEHPAHLRYQPGRGKTFCNIYAHDYCRLAGAYFPRVWWSSRALAELLQGGQPEPLLNVTVYERRINDLFRWLEEFGGQFGWRRVASPGALQAAANLGAVSMIVARTLIEGRSGHVALVVPEQGQWSARRNASGEVSAPLQSQAGSLNFKYGRGKLNWWTDPKFAEHAFWVNG